MKKMLILGGGHAEIPLIKAAKSKGYYVITTGNQASGLGHKYSDEFVNCDFSDKEKMLLLAKEKKVDAVCSGCNDFALLSTSYVCEKLNLPGHDNYETSLIIHHKDKYRKFACENKIPTPIAYKCYSQDDVQKYAEDIGYPVIVKPVDLTGGKGIMKCDNSKELTVAYHKAVTITRENYVIVEKYITGTNHGFSAFIQDKKVTFYFADNEQYYINKYMVSGASTPADVADSVIDRLCRYSEIISEKLELVDGILHIQYILSEENVPFIIEVCRRAPGDLYVRFVDEATKVGYADMIVSAESGEKIPMCSFRKPDAFYIRHCVMCDRKGKVEDVVFSDYIKKYIIDSLMWWNKGDVIEDELIYKAGIVFLKFDSREEMDMCLEKIHEHIKIVIE